MGVRSIIPSMFIRRLLLLMGLLLVAMVVLAGQTYRLTVLKGVESLDTAEKRLVEESWTPTIRGRILDRKGRVLAQDKAAFDVLVTYPLVSGDWAYQQAFAAARKKTGSGAWAKLPVKRRDALARECLPEFEAQVEKTWATLSKVLVVPREELERRRNRIRQDVQRIVAATQSKWLEKQIDEVGIYNSQGEEVSLSDVDRGPLGVQKQSYAIAAGVSEELAFALRRVEATLPGVQISETTARTYPFEDVEVTIDRSHFPLPVRDAEPAKIVVEGVATHVLGWMRKVQEEDFSTRPARDPVTHLEDRGQYLERDLVGGAGIEASQERTLRGLRGLAVKHLDTGDRQVEPSVPGKDVQLTLDVNLQARVQAIMDPRLGLAKLQEWQLSPLESQRPWIPVGTPLNGAAVVLDVETGEVLAMVSTPTFTREVLANEPSKVWEDRANTPAVNRCIQKPYPPGSIVKPMVLSSAVSAGVYSLSQKIECNGVLNPAKPEQFRCWIFKQLQTTHSAQYGGPLNGADAIEASCNIFFYTLGRDLGIEGIKRWFGSFGVGEGFGLGAGIEWPGSILRNRGKDATLGEAILMGIGQGPVDWTPMHAADVYATLARGGTRMVPRLLKDAPPVVKQLHLDPDAVDMALEGLRRSVNEEAGTGSHTRYRSGASSDAAWAGREEKTFSSDLDLDIRGKTGTAAAPRPVGLSVPAPDPDEDRDEDDPGRKKHTPQYDHSWFVVMVGPKGQTPKYAVSVIMEYAGSGGRVSGPIVHQIIWALKAEGYL